MNQTDRCELGGIIPELRNLAAGLPVAWTALGERFSPGYSKKTERLVWRRFITRAGRLLERAIALGAFRGDDAIQGIVTNWGDSRSMVGIARHCWSRWDTSRDYDRAEVEDGFASCVAAAMRYVADRVERDLASAAKPRAKREVARPLIAAHLQRRPHDTAREVADAISCGVGTVAQSPAWRANQLRLQDARAQGVEPVALPLASYLSAAGDTPGHQRRAQRDADAARDDELDRRERERNERIGKYRGSHPGATSVEVARAVGCTAGEVERREAQLAALIAEQTGSAGEDVSDGAQRRVIKHV